MPSQFPSPFGSKHLFRKNGIIKRGETKAEEVANSRHPTPTFAIAADNSKQVDDLESWIDRIELRAKSALEQEKQSTTEFYEQLRFEKQSEELKNRIFTDEFDKLEKMIKSGEERVQPEHNIENSEDKASLDEEEDEESDVEGEEDEDLDDIVEIISSEDEEEAVEEDEEEVVQEDDIEVENEQYEEEEDEEDQEREEEEDAYEEQELVAPQYPQFPQEHSQGYADDESIDEIEIIESEEDQHQYDEVQEEDDEDEEEHAFYDKEENDVDAEAEAGDDQHHFGEEKRPDDFEDQRSQFGNGQDEYLQRPLESPTNTAFDLEHSYRAPHHENITYNVRSGRPRLIDHMPRNNVFEEDQDDEDVDDEYTDEEAERLEIDHNNVHFEEEERDAEDEEDEDEDDSGEEEQSEDDEDLIEVIEDEEEMERGDFEKEKYEDEMEEDYLEEEQDSQKDYIQEDGVTDPQLLSNLLSFAQSALGPELVSDNVFDSANNTFDNTVIEYQTANNTMLENAIELAQEQSRKLENGEEIVEDAEYEEEEKFPRDENVNIIEMNSNADITNTEIKKSEEDTAADLTSPGDLDGLNEEETRVESHDSNLVEEVDREQEMNDDESVDIDLLEAPIFKTVPLEEPEEELNKLKEIESKYGLKLSSVPDLEHEVLKRKLLRSTPLHDTQEDNDKLNGELDDETLYNDAEEIVHEIQEDIKEEIDELDQVNGEGVNQHQEVNQSEDVTVSEFYDTVLENESLENELEDEIDHSNLVLVDNKDPELEEAIETLTTGEDLRSVDVNEVSIYEQAEDLVGKSGHKETEKDISMYVDAKETENILASEPNPELEQDSGSSVHEEEKGEEECKETQDQTDLEEENLIRSADEPEVRQSLDEADIEVETIHDEESESKEDSPNADESEVKISTSDENITLHEKVTFHTSPFADENNEEDDSNAAPQDETTYLEIEEGVSQEDVSDEEQNGTTYYEAEDDVMEINLSGEEQNETDYLEAEEDTGSVSDDDKEGIFFVEPEEPPQVDASSRYMIEEPNASDTNFTIYKETNLEVTEGDILHATNISEPEDEEIIHENHGHTGIVVEEYDISDEDENEFLEPTQIEEPEEIEYFAFVEVETDYIGTTTEPTSISEPEDKPESEHHIGPNTFDMEEIIEGQTGLEVSNNARKRRGDDLRSGFSVKRIKSLFSKLNPFKRNQGPKEEAKTPVLDETNDIMESDDLQKSASEDVDAVEEVNENENSNNSDSEINRSALLEEETNGEGAGEEAEVRTVEEEHEVEVSVELDEGTEQEIEQKIEQEAEQEAEREAEELEEIEDEILTQVHEQENKGNVEIEEEINEIIQVEVDQAEGEGNFIDNDVDEADESILLKEEVTPQEVQPNEDQENEGEYEGHTQESKPLEEIESYEHIAEFKPVERIEVPTLVPISDNEFESDESDIATTEELLSEQTNEEVVSREEMTKEKADEREPVDLEETSDLKSESITVDDNVDIEVTSKPISDSESLDKIEEKVFNNLLSNPIPDLNNSDEEDEDRGRKVLQRSRRSSPTRTRESSPYKRVLGLDVDVSEVNLSSTRSLRSRGSPQKYQRSVSPRKTSGKRGRKRKNTHTDSLELSPLEVELKDERKKEDQDQSFGISAEQPLSAELPLLSEELIPNPVPDTHKHEDSITVVKEDDSEPVLEESHPPPAKDERLKTSYIQDMLAHNDAFVVPKRKKRRLLKLKKR